MRLQILQVPGCPNAAKLEQRIRPAAGGRPMTLEIVHHMIVDRSAGPIRRCGTSRP